MSTQNPRIYLAGPEVFHPNSRALGAKKCGICTAVGLEGVFPLDAELDLSELAQDEQARRISLANEALMRSCDAIIANLTPFRGISMDAGTAFEVGFMRALGRPVFAYSNVGVSYAERSAVYRSQTALPFDLDRPELDVENFGLEENLMIAIAASESGMQVQTASSGTNSSSLEDLSIFSRCATQAARHLQGANLH